MVGARSLPELPDFSHEPLHLLRVHLVGPVPAQLKVGAHYHRVCIQVALDIVIGHS